MWSVGSLALKLNSFLERKREKKKKTKSDITRRRADRRMLEVGVLRPFLLFAPVLATEGVAGDDSTGPDSVIKEVFPLTDVRVTETAVTATSNKYCSTNCIFLDYET